MSHPTLEAFFAKSAHRTPGPEPLLYHWMGIPRMAPYVAIFDHKVERLLQRPGGTRKARDWLLSGDHNFANLTAERFAVDYLATKNPALEDRLFGSGVDAVLPTDEGSVGLEVTTLNGFVGHWIFTERLPLIFIEAGFGAGLRLRIKYDLARLAQEGKVNMTPYVECAAQAVMARDVVALHELDLEVTYGRGSGSIVWTADLPTSPGDPGYPRIPWLDLLTAGVLAKLQAPEKLRQLAEHPRNVVIIGVNNALPQAYPYPDVFQELAGVEPDHHGHASQVTQFWKTALVGHPHLTGIAYHTFAIDREVPYYPLQIIWRDDAQTIPLTT